MKKLLMALALVAGVSPLFAENGTVGANTDPNARANFRWMKNADAVSHGYGSVVVLYDGTYDGVEVATTTSASSKLAVGVVAAPGGSTAYSLPASDYGWVQVYGYHGAIKIGVANSAGDCLGSSTTAEKTTVTTTVGACVATALEATTSSTTVKGIIHGM